MLNHVLHHTSGHRHRHSTNIVVASRLLFCPMLKVFWLIDFILVFNDQGNASLISGLFHRVIQEELRDGGPFQVLPFFPPDISMEEEQRMVTQLARMIHIIGDRIEDDPELREWVSQAVQGPRCRWLTSDLRCSVSSEQRNRQSGSVRRVKVETFRGRGADCFTGWLHLGEDHLALPRSPETGEGGSNTWQVFTARLWCECGVWRLFLSVHLSLCLASRGLWKSARISSAGSLIVEDGYVGDSSLRFFSRVGTAIDRPSNPPIIIGIGVLQQTRSITTSSSKASLFVWFSLLFFILLFLRRSPTSFDLLCSFPPGIRYS